ncbi:MAG: hypothetical protein H6825_16220 [Planctomycetes bacterium]|nr:hypothetical protein [Planctomycetota bacterium]
MISVLVVGMVKLLGAHERLVSTLDTWATGEPTYWMHLPEDELRRVMGVPARLDPDPPTIEEQLFATLPEGPDAVRVEQVEKDLATHTVRARVRRLVALPEGLR